MIRSRLSVLFSLCFVLLLAACSSSKPESTVETFYKAVAKGDVDTAVKQIALGNISPGEMTAVKGKIQMMVGEMQQHIDNNGGLKKVEILETKVNENNTTATVRHKLLLNNGQDLEETNQLVKENGNWKIQLK